MMQYIKTFFFRKKWRRRNKHNFTWAYNCFDDSIVFVGEKTYGAINICSSSNTNKVFIGSYCSIGGEVEFIINSEHYTNHISTYPFKVKMLGEQTESFSKGDIIVEDDVWIGNRSTIMSGVHIGKGAIIAAGAVVTKDVPAYSIVGGVPAKVIKYRFSQEVINTLVKLDYSKFDVDFVKKNIDKIYNPINNLFDLEWIFKNE